MMHDVLGFILGGGRGAGLYPLTKLRSAPAVPIAGQYRLIDVPISNCINSGLRRIYVLTQFLSVSLHRHIANTYKFAPFTKSFVEVLAAQQTNEATDWYRGTADALRQNLRYLAADASRDVLILSGDGLYRMNFAELVKTHRDTGADVTMAVVPVRRAQASAYGVVKLDDADRLADLVEKPRTAEQLDALRAAPAWLARRGLTDGRDYLANMGIYLCRREFLLELLSARSDAVDLVTQYLAPMVRSRHVQGHLFDGYWLDVGTVKAYHEAHLALATATSAFDFYVSDAVIYTHMRNLPASRLRECHLDSCLVGEGALIQEGTRAERCVIGQRAQIGKGVVLRDSVVCGADRFETQRQFDDARAAGLPPVGIGDGCVIHRAILDKDCRVGSGVRILNEAEVREAEGDNYVIRDGIVVVPKGAVVPDGTVI